MVSSGNSDGALAVFEWRIKKLLLFQFINWQNQYSRCMTAGRWLEKLQNVTAATVLY